MCRQYRKIKQLTVKIIFCGNAVFNSSSGGSNYSLVSSLWKTIAKCVVSLRICDLGPNPSQVKTYLKAGVNQITRYTLVVVYKLHFLCYPVIPCNPLYKLLHSNDWFRISLWSSIQVHLESQNPTAGATLWIVVLTSVGLIIPVSLFNLHSFHNVLYDIRTWLLTLLGNQRWAAAELPNVEPVHSLLAARSAHPSLV